MSFSDNSRAIPSYQHLSNIPRNNMGNSSGCSGSKVDDHDTVDGMNSINRDKHNNNYNNNNNNYNNNNNNNHNNWNVASSAPLRNETTSRGVSINGGIEANYSDVDPQSNVLRQEDVCLPDPLQLDQFPSVRTAIAA